jgi:hypothetical protein
MANHAVPAHSPPLNAIAQSALSTDLRLVFSRDTFSIDTS